MPRRTKKPRSTNPKTRLRGSVSPNKNLSIKVRNMGVMVECPWCGNKVPIEEYARHYEECPSRQQTQTKKAPPKLKVVFTEERVTVYPAEAVY